MKKWLFACLIATALCLVANTPGWSAPPTPLDTIRTTVDTVIGYLRDKTLEPANRRDAISRTIRKRFDFEAMSRGTLARNWKKTSPEDRRRFISLFTRLLETTYLDRIEAYHDERVEYVSEKVKGLRAMVHTVIKTHVDIPVDYRVRLEGDEWYVYDVMIEGVSLVRNYRGSYGEIIHREGIEGLLARMETKLEELEKRIP